MYKELKTHLKRLAELKEVYQVLWDRGYKDEADAVFDVIISFENYKDCSKLEMKNE